MTETIRRRHPSRERTYAEIRREQAYWYAVSRDDLGGQHRTKAEGAMTFADWQHNVANAFDLGRISSISSVQDAFKVWQDTNGVVEWYL